MIFTKFMVLSLFQTLLSLTQCNQTPLLLLHEDVEFKIQIQTKNKYKVPNFCMIFTIYFYGPISISNLIESDPV